MNKINIFCFGFGQVAEAFINALIDRNINFKLGISSRKDTHQIEINNIKINSYMFDNDKFDESINNELEKANYILISIPPVNGENLVAVEVHQATRTSSDLSFDLELAGVQFTTPNPLYLKDVGRNCMTFSMFFLVVLENRWDLA